jgi:hypothetical protein
MTTATVAMKPCPSWCVLDAEHDLKEVEKGEDGRVHRTACVGDQLATWDDNPRDVEKAWWFEPARVYIWGATASEIATEMRSYAADILRLAEAVEEAEKLML